jgi:hypothetical protein
MDLDMNDPEPYRPSDERLWFLTALLWVVGMVYLIYMVFA